MSTSTELEVEVRTLLECAQTGFSVGGYGAIAEFSRDDGEQLVQSNTAHLEVGTARGAIRIALHADTVPIRYEYTGGHGDVRGIALCSSKKQLTRGVRDTITELGPDVDAISPHDRAAILFDLGLALPNAEFCVRSSDAVLTDWLRAHQDQALLAKGEQLIEHLIDASPHRVVRSSIARIEVFQGIDRTQSPSGPHTHLLPKLLRKPRTHDRRMPIPDGLTPLLMIYPPRAA